MDLQKFKETYSKLEDKAYQIMKVYGLSHYGLDTISLECYDERTSFNIKMSIFYSGCDTEYEELNFDLEEMNNDISYFENKRKESEDKKARARKITEENIIKNRETQNKAEYERLKLIFES